jgi:Fic family protein
MNCYYSSLIENHNTTLIDIERALKDDFAKEPEKRNLQLEAKAHIEVQAMIDRGRGLKFSTRSATRRLRKVTLLIYERGGSTFRRLPWRLRPIHQP